jgi:hypothetical protein
MILSSFKVSVQHLMLLQKLEKQPLSGRDVYSKLNRHLVDLRRLLQQVEVEEDGNNNEDTRK